MDIEGIRSAIRARTDGGEPGPLFDRDWYLATNPDVAAAQVDPWRHYLEFGAAEGRDPNPLFDSDWYLERNPDAAARKLNPLLHYWRIGAAQGRDPCAQFDTAWYLRSNPDLRPRKLTPLGDYLKYGRLEGRSIAPPPRMNGAARARPAAGRGARIAVYTAITGHYDCLKFPTQIDENCDYYCFTDRDISWQGVWVRREFGWRHADPVRVARHIKLHPHLYLPGHDWSIWIDANIQLNCLPRELMPPSPDDWDLAVWRHPERDCLYEEAEVCAVHGKDDAATIRAQVRRYRERGFPEHAGLMENNVLVRRHNAPAMIEFSRAWWREIENGSRRDQLSFPFVAAQLALRIASLVPEANNARVDPRLRFFSHNRRRP